VDSKTNEIPTARTLIERLDLQGKMTQLDGMHTQHQTVHQILYEKGGDYSLILRDNQPTILKTAQTLLPADIPPQLQKTDYRGGRREYRAIVVKAIEPKQLGLAGAIRLARVDRQIGKKGQLTRTWLAASRALSDKEWLGLEQQRWGIENRTHHTLDVTHREDESRVQQPNAASVLGIFRRLSNAFKQVWAKGRPKRAATSRDWTERITSTAGEASASSRDQSLPKIPHESTLIPLLTLTQMSLMHPWLGSGSFLLAGASHQNSPPSFQIESQLPGIRAQCRSKSE